MATETKPFVVKNVGSATLDVSELRLDAGVDAFEVVDGLHRLGGTFSVALQARVHRHIDECINHQGARDEEQTPSHIPNFESLGDGDQE